MRRRPAQGEPASSGATPFATVRPAGTRFGPIRRFAEIDSTNRYLLDEARAGRSRGRGGGGRLPDARAGAGSGRRWEAPPGSNLLVSVLLRPTLAVERAPPVHGGRGPGRRRRPVSGGAGVVPDLKWPNDLMVGERKLGGILAEAAAGRARRRPPPGGGGGAGAQRRLATTRRCR